MLGQPTSAGRALQPSPRAHSFQVGSSWHTSFGKLVTKWIQIPTHQELDSSTREWKQELDSSSHHHYFKRMASNSLPDSTIFKFASYNQYSKLTAFIELLNVSTHIGNFTSQSQSFNNYLWTGNVLYYSSMLWRVKMVYKSWNRYFNLGGEK